MKLEPLDQIVAELESEDWIERGSAIHKLAAHGRNAERTLPSLFRLTFDERAPVASHSKRLIKRLGKVAVPFLISQTQDSHAPYRARALELLTESGCRWATTTRMPRQLFDKRRDHLPEWGCDPEDVFRLFETALQDDSMAVRFAAACALEEFGRSLPQTIPVFIATLESGSQHQKNWAALHLGRIGPDAHPARSALKTASQSDCQYTALAASNALKLIGDGDKAIYPPRTETLFARSPRVRLD